MASYIGTGAHPTPSVLVLPDRGCQVGRTGRWLVFTGATHTEHWLGRVRRGLLRVSWHVTWHVVWVPSWHSCVADERGPVLLRGGCSCSTEGLLAVVGLCAVAALQASWSVSAPSLLGVCNVALMCMLEQGVVAQAENAHTLSH